MKRLLAVPVLALALAGCGSDSGNDEAASTNPSSPPPMQTTTSGCESLSGASTDPQKQTANETMYLTSVAIKPGTCTVVFGFEAQAPGPGYEVSYQPASTAKVEDGSGNPVSIEGSAFLVVKLTPAMTAKIDGDQVTKTYTGPRRLSGDGAITEVVKTGDFESVVTWVIGVDSERPFTVDASDDSLVVAVDGS
jgi:hypothetical protein